MTYFFLSYARGHDDAYVEQFYDDLSQEIRRRTGLPADEAVGFLDTRDLAVGTRWHPELAEALADCKVFVAIYSPRYFTRPNCGREWAAFTARMRAYERATGQRPRLLLPVLWVPQESVPGVADEIQFVDATLGSTYLQWGLFPMLRIGRFADDYREFLVRLSTKMLDAADRHPLPRADSLDLDRLPNAFADAPSGRPHPGDPASSPTAARPTGAGRSWRPAAGGGHVEFVFVVGTPDELPPERTLHDRYGATAAEWRPYLPVEPAPVSLLVQRAAVDHDLTSNVTDARDDAGEEELVERLSAARENNQILVLLVDAWTTRIAGYRRMLRAYDSRNEPTTEVLVPWNEQDEDLRAAEDELRQDVHDAFPENVVRRDPLFRSELRTPETFGAGLRDVLVEAQNRMFTRGAVRRRAGGTTPVELPTLQTP